MKLTNTYTLVEGLEIRGKKITGFEKILSHDAQCFLIELHKRFNNKRKDLLSQRQLSQKEINNGELPNFPSETKAIREGNWQVAPLPPDLLDRRVEITGPVDRKMIINALNSGAKVFMADFEDSNAPSWENTIQGQINLKDAVDKTISFVNPKNNKSYQLNEKIATLMVRPRGWHLQEKHILYKGEMMSAGLVDFGLFFFHNAHNLIARGSGPYFYLPKLEHYLEARLWNDAFVFAQQFLNIPQQTIKATVLIETILASFQLDEILYELRDHSAGLNCGRWDYIFSFIKRFRNINGFVLPDRAKVGMTVPFMSAYSELVIKVCHKRGVHAMGGMAAQIPIKNNIEANDKAIQKVKDDKLREVKNGHDGTWVAHPGLVKIATDIFNDYMPEANQIKNKRNDIVVTAANLIEVPQDSITEHGVRENINVGILYIESWLRGIGAAALYNLMEDAATAEISRSQLWQWIQKKSKLDDGRTVTFELYEELLPEELKKIKDYVGIDNYNNGRFDEAIKLFTDLIKKDEFIEFLTLPAYDLL
ncbi:MAG: malate synthase A [Saprospiraceae bacterium]|nr:malate synthase A [Saprospiraceae bacterium]